VPSTESMSAKSAAKSPSAEVSTVTFICTTFKTCCTQQYTINMVGADFRQSIPLQSYVARADPLRDDAFEAQAAGLPRNACSIR
jgi:hypothetical protein